MPSPKRYRKSVEKPRAEMAEEATASPCPFCNYRPIKRDSLSGMWSCSNCGERGMLMFDAGWPPRETGVPMPLELDHA
jgi:ribosomal protein L37AE/L43A